MSQKCHFARDLWSQLDALRLGMKIISHLYFCIKEMGKRYGMKITIEESPDYVRYENVTIRTADESQILIEDLNAEVPRGVSMLCTGNTPGTMGLVTPSRRICSTYSKYSRGSLNSCCRMTI